jgi:hypothetical protein
MSWRFRPLADDALPIAAMGEKEDRSPVLL